MVEKKLRSSVRGYNKEDVHTYIAVLDSSMKEKIIAYENNLIQAKKDAQKQDEEFMQALKGKDQRIEELISAKVASEKVAQEASQEIKELAGRINALELDIERKNAEISAITASKTELESQLNVLLQERDKIPEVLIKAEEKADSVIGQAEKKAETVVQSAKKDAEDILAQASKIAENRLESAEEKYKKVLAESDEFKRKVIISRQNLIAAMSAYKKALDEALAD
ncbi:MAG: hypothetical protein IJC89_00875 [Clostridia bacterium]|nr:hypothetical protein [Clostridia bacterium]